MNADGDRAVIASCDRYDVNIRKLFRSRVLKPGVIVTVKPQHMSDGHVIITETLKATVVDVYPYISIVDEHRRVDGRDRTRRTSYTNTELMLWNVKKEKKKK